MRDSFIYTAVVGAVIASLVGLFFIQTNISQESSARNILDIPRLVVRLEKLEEESNRYRQYYLDLADEVYQVKGDLKSVESTQKIISQDFLNFKSRVYDNLLQN